MSSKITTLTDENNNNLYPITSTDAVFDSNNNNLTNIIAGIKGDFSRKITFSDTGSITKSIDPGIYYEFSGIFSSLTLNLNPPASGYSDVYCIRFKTDETIPTLTVNYSEGNLLWCMVTPDTLTEYCYYELNIIGNVASLIPLSMKLSLTKSLLLQSNSADGGFNGGTLTITRNKTNTETNSILLFDEIYTITASAKTNFSLYSLKKDNVSISSGTTFAATSDSTIEAIFKGNSTTITWNSPTGATINIRKDSSSGTSLSSGSSINYYDRVYISITGETNYTTSFTVSGLTQYGLSTTSNVYRVTALNPSISITSTYVEPSS